MAIGIGFSPFIPEAFEGMTDQELDVVRNFFLSPTLRMVAEKQHRLHEEQRISLDPAQYSATDYYDTMLHLKRVSDLWQGMADYCQKAIEAHKLQQASKETEQ